MQSTDPSSPESGTESSILSVYHGLRSDLTRADKSLCGETIAGTKGLVNLEEKKKETAQWLQDEAKEIQMRN